LTNPQPIAHNRPNNEGDGYMGGSIHWYRTKSGERPFLIVWWRGRSYKLYRDKQGRKFYSKERAEKLLRAIQVEIDNKTFDPTDYTTQAQTFERFWQTFMAEYQPRTSTRDKLNAIYKHHFSPLADKNIKEITGLDIKQWWLDMREKGLSSKYLNDCRQWLLSVFREAGRLQVIERIPAFPKPVRNIKKPVQYLDKEDQVRILLALPEYDQPVYSFMMLSGCRVMEAAALQWEDINWKEDTFTISRSIDRHGKLGPPKDRDPRILPLFPKLKALLSTVRQKRVVSLTGFVFLNRWGTHYSYEYLREHFHEARKIVGVSEIPLKNATRASWATQQDRNNIWLVAQAMGHSDIETTKAYLGQRPDHLRVLFE
jgi:integrase